MVPSDTGCKTFTLYGLATGHLHEECLYWAGDFLVISFSLFVVPRFMRAHSLITFPNTFSHHFPVSSILEVASGCQLVVMSLDGFHGTSA